MDRPTRFGKYLLLRQVALGGMAEIFLAVDDTNAGQRFVTIKRIKSDFDRDDEYVQFFMTEGRIALRCAHPNLPQAYEMGEVAGSYFLAMEYIHGHTLLDVVRAAALSRRPLSVSSAVHVGIGVAAALEHAHNLRDVSGRSLGVVHRDVTPQNVMLSVSGGVKLIDFGIVRAAIQTHKTQIGVVKGKFSYMAPETLTHASQLDHRADIFALGIVLHETLTGRSLFRGEHDTDTIERVRTMPIPDLSRLRKDVPVALSRVVMRALERDPDRRFQSATELMQELEATAESCGIHHSMIRLRDEVLDRCGMPPEPAFGSAPPPREPVLLPPTPSARRTPVPAPAPRVTGDPELAYFLRKAGALPGVPHEQPTQSDHDLSQLLASLDS
ncbi:MAG TPA: serine/threonine-protein kinase [Kofleriaceae bacterium]|nr:serine/threonine-protein kinase [Kofleriaceae bacterium]